MLMQFLATRTVAQGILVGWTTGVDVHIARNRVSNASPNSIEAIQNYQGFAGSGRVRVEGNTITTPSIGLPWPGPATPNGIVAGFPFDPAAAVDLRRNIRYELEKNAIEARGRTSIGVVVSSDGAVAIGALVERARARVARVIHAAFWRSCRRSRT